MNKSEVNCAQDPLTMAEEIDRLARFDKKLRGILSLKETLIENTELQLSEARAQIAMLADAITHLRYWCKLWVSDDHQILSVADNALSATAETVAAWRTKETEPLRREVMMLRDALSELKSESWLVPVQQLMYRGNTVVRKANVAINDTQATALAYEREVENRGAMKALEDAAKFFEVNDLFAHQNLLHMAAELRAAK